MKLNRFILTVLALFLFACGQERAAQSESAVASRLESSLDAQSRYLDEFFADALAELERAETTNYPREVAEHALAHHQLPDMLLSESISAIHSSSKGRL